MNEFENEQLSPQYEAPQEQSLPNNEEAPKEQNCDTAAEPLESMPTQSAEQPTPAPEGFGAEAWSKVNYTPVDPIKDYRPASKGLRVFSAIICCVILATSSCVAGYFLGKSNITAGKGTGKKVTVELEKKPEDTNGYTPTGVYEKLNASIVGIRVYNSAGKMSDATGVIYTQDGYIVTNDHIYSEIGAPHFKVYTSDGSEYDASYVAGDTISDLAVLKIDGSFTAAVFGDSTELNCGEEVVAVGRPSDAMGNSSITSGIVSLPKRRVKTTSNYSVNLIETDSAINPGSSGGALVNMYGQVVGITSAKLAGVNYDSVGYAIPTVTVKRVAEQLIKDGKVTNRAKLGITYQEVTSVTAAVNGSDAVGLYVASVSSDSDAYGRLAEGDVITEVNGTAITNDDIMLDVVDESVAGDTISITVTKTDGATESYDIKLKANIGESSYSSVLNSDSQSESSGNGETFNFPNGE